MRAQANAAPGKNLQAHGPGKAQRRRQPGGIHAAAAQISLPVELDAGGVIGMHGAGDIAQRVVIAAVRAMVLYHRAQRRAAGMAVRQAAEHMRDIAFHPRGGVRLTGRAAAQKGLRLV